MNDGRAIRVVVVEDSETQLAHLVRVLERHGMEVAGQAATTRSGVDTTRRSAPDVVLMDLDLPGAGGQAAIEQIMAEHPVPILVLSSTFDSRSAAPVVAALAAGAVEARPKPKVWTSTHEDDLARLVRMVSGVQVVRRRAPIRPPDGAPDLSLGAAGATVIGAVASTGGPGALAAMLEALGPGAPPVLVVQHIHEGFVAAFTEWLARKSQLEVTLAEDGEALRSGHVYVAPAGLHLLLGPRRRLQLADKPALLHRPSGDLLLGSLAEHAGARAIGVVLTGMGADGARGLLAIREAGGTTLVQDEQSSVVFGMPRAAKAAGAAEHVLSPDRIGSAISKAARA